MTPFRHVALLKIRGQNSTLVPISLRTVRPFVVDEVQLTSAAEDEGFDANDQVAVSAFLKAKVCQHPTVSSSLPLVF